MTRKVLTTKDYAQCSLYIYTTDGGYSIYSPENWSYFKFSDGFFKLYKKDDDGEIAIALFKLEEISKIVRRP